MTETNLGRVAIVPQGDYSASVQYAYLDAVLYEGSTYLCKAVPPVGALPTNETYFTLMAQGLSDAQIAEHEPIDALDSTSATRPLSANQGRVLDAKISASQGNLLGGIAFDASAPTPATNGRYIFTSAGSCTWITGGAVTVAVNDEVLVTYTAPSTYVYTYLSVSSNFVRNSGSETIAGVKTFSSPPIVPMCEADYEAAPKKYIDDIGMFYVTPNLFDKTAITPNMRIDDSTGLLTPAEGYYTSDFMVASEVNNISNSAFTFIAIYDADENYISGIAAGGQFSINALAIGNKFRISPTFVTSPIDTLQVEAGTTSTAYQPYGKIRLFKTDADINDDFTSTSATEIASAREVTELYGIVKPTYTTITARRYSGGDFNGNNAIQDAIDSITDASETNQYIIEPKGVFVAYLPEHYTKQYTILYSFILLKPYVHLVSKNRDECIIMCTLSDNLGTDFEYSKYQNINHNVNNSRVEGVTFIASNIRYAVHIDGVNTDYNIAFKNCKVWNKGNTGDALTVWASPSPFGVGMSSGMKLLIEDCEVKGIDYALYAHTNNTFSDASEIRFNRCKISTTNSKDNIIMYAQPLGSGCSDRFIVENCQVDEGGIDFRSTPWCPEELINQRADHAEYDLILPSMKPRAFYNSALSGWGLRIKSKSTGSSSTVSIDSTSTAFDLIIGNSAISVEYINRYNRNQIYGYQYKNGGNGLSGYAIGTLDIGMYKVGAGVDKYIGALGKRLGDCTVVNKTLTLAIDGTTYNIVFDKNYNGTAETVAPTYTNTQIIAEITAVIGEVATADEYCIGQDYYPQFEGVLNMKNADTTEVLSGMGVVFTGLKTFRKALNSDGKIDGVCLDDGMVGDECRIITDGEICSNYTAERFRLYENEATSRSVGTLLGISTTTAGQFVASQTPSVMLCVRDNVFSFI